MAAVHHRNLLIDEKFLSDVPKEGPPDVPKESPSLLFYSQVADIPIGSRIVKIAESILKNPYFRSIHIEAESPGSKRLIVNWFTKNGLELERDITEGHVLQPQLPTIRAVGDILFVCYGGAKIRLKDLASIKQAQYQLEIESPRGEVEIFLGF